MKLPRCFVFLIQFGTHMVGLIQHSVKEFSNGEHEDNGILFEQCVCSNHYRIYDTEVTETKLFHTAYVSLP
jgi:hypothetical protein